MTEKDARCAKCGHPKHTTVCQERGPEAPLGHGYCGCSFESHCFNGLPSNHDCYACGKMTWQKEEPCVPIKQAATAPADLVITSQAALGTAKPGAIHLRPGGATWVGPLLSISVDATSFFTPDGKEILRLEADGSILVRGERTYAKDVVDGMCAWLDSMGLLPK
jgi:hypothetical protein